MDTIKRFFVEDEGSEVPEWVLFFALLAFIAIAAVNLLSPNLEGAFEHLGSSVLNRASQVN
jgi:Flp pilus assembly pilin Flp